MLVKHESEMVEAVAQSEMAEAAAMSNCQRSNETTSLEMSGSREFPDNSTSL